MADKAAFSYDVFFRGVEGFGEHFQITAEDSSQLLEGRKSLVTALNIMEAKPLPRDLENQGRSFKPAGNTAPPPAVGTTPVCPTDGAPMRLRQPREGQTWPAFWSCQNYPSCSGKRNA